jgi:3-mercaptopyruvate sulfurtransferase SseA
MSTVRIKKRRRTHIGPLLLIAFGMLLIGLMIWQLSGRAAATSSTGSNPTNATEIVRVKLDSAQSAVDRGEAVWLDVRDDVSFSSGHIPGALNIPLNQIESRLSTLDPDQWYITYCT